MGPQIDFCIVDERFGLIADDLTHDNRLEAELGAQRFIPGPRIPLRLIRFKYDEIGDRLDPHGDRTSSRRENRQRRLRRLSPGHSRGGISAASR